MAHDCHVYLVPGFFGFTSLGALNYFHRVSGVLGDALAARGVQARIIETRTRPTGSIRNRADRLLEDVLATGGADAPALHFVGHSTGGLDIRLLVTPDVKLRGEGAEERVGRRVRSVTSIATPHFGTPMANFFTTLQGRQLLRALTLLATTDQGRTSIFLAAQLAARLASADDRLGLDRTLLDRLSEVLLRRITLDRADPVWEFLREVAADQGALIQLTPEGMNLYNAAVTPRPGVDYRCVVTAAKPPFAFGALEFARLSAWRKTTATVFAFLHALTSREHSHYPYPSPAEDERARIQVALPFALTEATNDGVVPTLSQIYGEPLLAVVADHLDVVGQFMDAGGDPLSDWLASGSGFDEARFQQVWGAVADAIVAAHGA